jgi:PPK2 family polyphosphate:nucleotide phosphotransferase
MLILWRCGGRQQPAGPGDPMLVRDVIDRFRVRPGTKVKLKDFDPAWAGDEKLPKKERKLIAQKVLTENVAALAAAQELLYAADSWAVLVIFQAPDAAGKDSTIKHVMSGVNPQGCQVYSFKHPSAEELDHTFLWRCMKVLPERGRIGIFNRSYYEEVLIVKVHKELVRAEHIPDADPDSRKFWQARYDDMNHFERHLTRNGTVVLKFFLHVSKEEQRQRFLSRLREADKNWKFSMADAKERNCWDAYQEAYEDAIRHTASEHAPWYVVPADHKWFTRMVVSAAIVDALEELDLTYPVVDTHKREELKLVQTELEKEGPVREKKRK